MSDDILDFDTLLAAMDDFVATTSYDVPAPSDSPDPDDLQLSAKSFAEVLKFHGAGQARAPAGSPQGGEFVSTVTFPPRFTSAVPKFPDRPLPRYGTPVAGAVSVVGMHFSSQPRETIDSSYYGSGMRGHESQRLKMPSADARLSERLHFYVDEGHGVTPESGVGAHAHRVQLDNLYDPTKDDRTLWRTGKGDLNASEKAVMDAGYDGYYVKNASPKSGVAVLLGKHTVPVQPWVNKSEFSQALKFNPYHGADGRFASAGGGSVFGEDMAQQSDWLDSKAKLFGYKNVDDLFALNNPAFIDLAAVWRKTHALKGFSEVLKANPYHDAAGRFATNDGATFVSTGERFAKTIERIKATQTPPFKRASTLREALKVAEASGAPAIITTKAGLQRALLNQQDERWYRMTPPERADAFPDQGRIKPSLNEKSIKSSKWLGEGYYKHEIALEGKDPFAIPEETRLLAQNLLNYNQTLPKHAKAVAKFGNVPMVPFAFGARTSLMQYASGQYEAGVVFANTMWHPPAQAEKSYDESLNPKGRSVEGNRGAVFLNGGLAGTLRHEYGHHIHSTVMERHKAAEWDVLHTQVSGLPAAFSHQNTEMGFDKNTPMKGISSYAQANSMESFAETYALMTSKNFNRNAHDKAVHPLFDFMDREIFNG